MPLMPRLMVIDAISCTVKFRRHIGSKTGRHRCELAENGALSDEGKNCDLNTWLDSRGLERGDSRIQADAYFAVMFLGRAMKHLKQNFSREFLIEVLEHALDNATFTSVYPRVSLGPGQRFASKGSYILELSNDENPEWQPVSDWIIP